MSKKGDVARVVWQALVDSYAQGGRTKVEVPVEDVMDILTSLFANVLSQVADASEREAVLRDLPRKVDRFLSAVREKPNLHIPSKSPLILPH